MLICAFGLTRSTRLPESIELKLPQWAPSYWTKDRWRTEMCGLVKTGTRTTSDSWLAIMPEIMSTDPSLDRLRTDQDLGRLQFTTLLYYLQSTNPDVASLPSRRRSSCQQSSTLRE
jgi:hypothetical protein